MECSHFEPTGLATEESEASCQNMMGPIPCVIYLHGNCASRLEALSLVDHILPMGMSLFCFDFAGCGLSEGEFVSLGWHERDDLEIVVDFLRKQKTKVSTIGLWGRSMGAVTALMYAEKDLSIGGMVLDSPFSDLKVLVKDLAKTHSNVPSVLVNGALTFVKNSVKKRAHFDISNVKPLSHADHCYVPALFGVATDDELISP